MPVCLTPISKPATAMPLDAPEPLRPMKCPLPIFEANKDAPTYFNEEYRDE